MSHVVGVVSGLSWPRFSINVPSRGAVDSATTTRYAGCFLAPVRRSLIFSKSQASPACAGCAPREWREYKSDRVSEHRFYTRAWEKPDDELRKYARPTW